MKSMSLSGRSFLPEVPVFSGGCYVTVKRNNIKEELNHILSQKEYNHTKIESLAKEAWEGDPKRSCLRWNGGTSKISKTFSIPIPPPNITGNLHLGHAIFLGLQDSIIRWHLMRGAKTEWKPGCDHAGMATHEKIRERILSKGENPEDLQIYEKTAEEWEKEASEGIFKRFERLGCALDPGQPRYTLDKGFKEATEEAFKILDKRGRISRAHDGNLHLDLRSEYREIIKALNDGELSIEPESHKGRLISMLKEERTWEITRSIPWGHKHPDRNDGYSPMTLDTWFTSSLWPLGMRGWPNNQEPFEKGSYDLMETGYDILFFWCARMLAMSKALGQPWPFKRIFLHGLMRDSKGRKFSKSLGNGIDPLEICDSHGADALRLCLIHSTIPGADGKFMPQALSEWSRALQKLHSAGRLLMARKPPSAWWDGSDFPMGETTLRLAEEMEERLLSLDFRGALTLWKSSFLSFCRGELEISKARLHEDAIWTRTAGELAGYLELLHPFAPHITWAWTQNLTH